MSALCVECDAELNLGGRVRIGQRILCPNCGVQLEVISTRPLEVDVAYDDGEEWDDLDGYSLDDDDDLEDVGRINGASALDDWDDDENWNDDLDELEDGLEDGLEDDLEGDLEGDLDDDLDDDLNGDLNGDWGGKKDQTSGRKPGKQ